MLTVDSIVVELYIVSLYLSPLIIASVSTILAGSILLFIYRGIMKKKITLFKDKKTWKYIIIISVFFSIAELTWYDSISHIGSGKTSLLNLPLEAIILVWFILGERLRQFQIVGASIAIVGFTLSASIKQNRAHI
jgi:drug/metabolite transporter (DMT)-like permease